MGDVIGFLARVGREASLRHADGDTFGAVLDEAGFDPATREALRVRDGDALRAHLGYGVYFASQMGEPLQPDSVEVPPSKEEEQEDDQIDPESPESSQ